MTASRRLLLVSALLIQCVQGPPAATSSASQATKPCAGPRDPWRGSTFDRWHEAIASYEPSVRTDKQKSLNHVPSPYPSYLLAIHKRLHLVFAEQYLCALETLPGNNPINDLELFTRLEIVLDPSDGHITKMGVVKSSGITAFDIAALDSFERASPFGELPSSIVSADGQVYLQWELNRDPVFACSAMNAHPFLLRASSKSSTQAPAPSGGGDTGRRD